VDISPSKMLHHGWLISQNSTLWMIHLAKCCIMGYISHTM